MMKYLLFSIILFAATVILYADKNTEKLYRQKRKVCKDKNGIYCLHVINWCSRWPLLLKVCAKTCKRCVATSKPPESGCIDKHPSKCYQWRSYCKHNWRYKIWMTKHCAKTCGICATTPKPANQVTAKPPVSVATPKPGSCGTLQTTRKRVISGVNAKKGSWPWQILMLSSGNPFCGGTLIAPKWVVTAAHCVAGKERSIANIFIRVGEFITTTTEDGRHTDIRVEKIISHPSYSRSTINNDIALLKLESPAPYGKRVQPICLPGQDQDVPIGTDCYITGWGKIEHPARMHHTLQQAKMPIVSNAACTNMNTKVTGVRITDKMVCAGHGGSTSVSGCHGDSGGPLACKTGADGSWVLHGAVSWGSKTCNAKHGYTVFARVAKFRNWIDEHMSKN